MYGFASGVIIRYDQIFIFWLLFIGRLYVTHALYRVVTRGQIEPQNHLNVGNTMMHILYNLNIFWAKSEALTWTSNLLQYTIVVQITPRGRRILA